jgi:hypothetical protein
VYAVDSSNPSNWMADVNLPASHIVEAYLAVSTSVTSHKGIMFAMSMFIY